MPWFRMDIHWHEDPDIELAADQSSGAVFAVFPVLLAKAKAHANGGKVEVAWSKLGRDLRFSESDVRAAVEALSSAGVLSCPQVSARSAEVAFDPGSWRRWQEAQRKAASREEAKAA